VSAANEFRFSHDPEPHAQRTRDILARYPDIRRLMGQRNPWTFAIVVAAVGLQLYLSWLVRDAAWWQNLAVAYLVGAFASHTLFVCIHEATHHLIFRSRRGNLATAVLANLPSLVPTALTFRHFHLKHHAHQGVEALDADLPSRWEARLIGRYCVGKALWLLFFPIFQSLRTLRVTEVKAFDRWTALNFAVQFVFTASVYYFWGAGSLLYLLASFWFSVGLHPLGARWIQEHWLTLDPEQETYSYYGPLNVLNLNVGFHNEHHDFPSVPWNALPEVKRMAPEFYDHLKFHDSMTRLFLQFLFAQEISLFSRMVRNRRGDAK
jgi:sphingolipid 4-desaturase/C4-monooxygenase